MGDPRWRTPPVSLGLAESAGTGVDRMYAEMGRVGHRPPLAYRRRNVDSDDRTLIGLVRETKEINARMVRLALWVEGPAATRALADLVARGLLVKKPGAERGPSVTYGPGPAFPKSLKSSAGEHTLGTP